MERPRQRKTLLPDYWAGSWRWYDTGGDRHVAAYLASIDLSAFDPKAPPPKTEAFWAIVDASRAPEDAELADVLDILGNPDAVTLVKVQATATGGFQDWLCDRRNRRQIPHRFEQCGYVPVRNDARRDRLWVINGRRQVVYGQGRLATARKAGGGNGIDRNGRRAQQPQGRKMSRAAVKAVKAVIFHPTKNRIFP